MGKNGQLYDLVIKKFDESIESKLCDRETSNNFSMIIILVIEVFLKMKYRNHIYKSINSE